jgi:hypothetical protein
MRSFKLVLFLVVLMIGSVAVQAQRPSSPRGEAATHLGGEFEGRTYQRGMWIVVDYGRPILRGRTNIFGEGEKYGQKASASAPVWRAGANKSTRFSTDAALSFGKKTLPAGEYSLFIDLKASGWTLIFSNHAAKNNFRDPGDGLWGAYNYTADKDVLRVPMKVAEHSVSFDQLTYSFVNMSKSGGTLSIMWEKTMATADFSLAK